MLVRRIVLIAVLCLSVAGFAIAQQENSAKPRKNQSVSSVAKETAPAEAPAAPEIEVKGSLLPADGGFINNAKPVISAEYLDEGIGISPTDTKIFIDDQDMSKHALVTPNKIICTLPAPLADGRHSVKLDLVDKAGNLDSVTWSFTIKTLPPVVKIMSHKTSQHVNLSPVAITGSINDTNSRIVVNGVVAAIEKGVFTAKVNLVEGNNTLTAIATDAFGNAGNDTITIVLDSKPPIVNITGPSPNSLMSAMTITVTGTVDKKASIISVSTGTGPEMPAALIDGSFTAQDVKLREGENTIVVKAVSQAGNTGTASVKVTIDTIAPVITLTEPVPMTITNKKMITVSGTVDDPSAMIKINNIPVQVVKGVFTLSSVNLSEGMSTITATASDRAGNQALPASVSVILDTMPPSAPALNSLPPVVRSQKLMLTGTSEPGSRVDVFVNSTTKGTVKADDRGLFAMELSLAEGNNGITAVVYDGPGNASAPSPVLNVYLDTKAPKVL